MNKISSIEELFEDIDEGEMTLRADIRTTYNRKLCPIFISHCENGLSIIAIAAAMKVHRATFLKWMEFEEWREAVLIGEQLYVAHWEDIIAKNCTGEMKGNAQILQFYLKNRLSSLYKDKLEVEYSGQGSIQVITNVPFRELSNADKDMQLVDYTGIESQNDDRGLDIL